MISTWITILHSCELSNQNRFTSDSLDLWHLKGVGLSSCAQVVSNPVEKYLPPGSRRFGMSVNGRQAPGEDLGAIGFLSKTTHWQKLPTWPWNIHRISSAYVDVSMRLIAFRVSIWHLTSQIKTCIGIYTVIVYGSKGTHPNLAKYSQGSQHQAPTSILRHPSCSVLKRSLLWVPRICPICYKLLFYRLMWSWPTWDILKQKKLREEIVGTFYWKVLSVSTCINPLLGKRDFNFLTLPFIAGEDEGFCCPIGRVTWIGKGLMTSFDHEPKGPKQTVFLHILHIDMAMGEPGEILKIFFLLGKGGFHSFW